MASTTVFDMEPPSGNQPNPRAPRPLFRAATKEEEADDKIEQAVVEVDLSTVSMFTAQESLAEEDQQQLDVVQNPQTAAAAAAQAAQHQGPRKLTLLGWGALVTSVGLAAAAAAYVGVYPQSRVVPITGTFAGAMGCCSLVSGPAERWGLIKREPAAAPLEAVAVERP